MIVEIPLGLGTYAHRVQPYSDQVCQNLYAEVGESPALSQSVHLPTPGFVQVATAGNSGTSACRGAGRLAEKPYFVCGGALYRLEADETLTELGEIPGSGRVFMSENPTQLMVLVPGVDGYIYTEAGGLVKITDVDFKEANGIPVGLTFIDGYFVCVTDGNKITTSELNDGTTWRALDFASAESSPDGLVVPFVHKNQLHIAGTRTIEQFTNVGGANFPFARTNAFQDKGLAAPHALVNTGEATVFLGKAQNEKPSVYILSSEAIQRIATPVVDQALSDLTLSEVQNVYAWTYSDDGHQFIGFQLPSETFVLDLATGQWHTRTSRIEGARGRVEDAPSRVAAIVSGYGKLYVGDLFDGRVGELSSRVYSEYGQAILREIVTPPYHNDRQFFAIPFLELAVDSGGGFDVEMSVSRDGGRTWSDPRKRTSDGSVYSRRLVWRRCGRFKETACFRFRSASAGKIALIALYGSIKLDPEKEMRRLRDGS